MSAFFQALGQGYNPQQILGYLSQSIPQMAKPIKKAQKAGYTVEQILGFLSKNFDNQDRRGMTETERHTANRRADAERTKYGLKMAATAVAVPIASTALSSALSRSLPQSLKQLAPSVAAQSPLPGGGNAQTPPAGNILPGTQTQPTLTQPQATQQQSSAQNGLSSVSQQPPSVSNVTSVTKPIQSMQPQGIVNPREYLDKLGVREKVDSLLNAGNTPEGAAAAIGVKRSGDSKIDPELLANIESYAQESLRNEAMQPERSQPISPNVNPEEVSDDLLEQARKLFKETGNNHPTFIQRKLKIKYVDAARLSDQLKSENEKELPEEKPTINKGSLASSPQGIGEIKELRNGQALIDVDGKLHKVSEDELIQSPLPEKDLAELYDELISGIESETGEDVSRMVQWAGYNPETNTLQFLPHTGKLYKYGNISEEDAALLTDILSTRKTSGENFIGAWKAGSKSPIGAALSKLIRKLQSERGGKGNEYEETHDPIYSAYEPAVQAKKKKKKK